VSLLVDMVSFLLSTAKVGGAANARCCADDCVCGNGNGDGELLESTYSTA
jgi:hypothetical protein